MICSGQAALQLTQFFSCPASAPRSTSEQSGGHSALIFVKPFGGVLVIQTELPVPQALR